MKHSATHAPALQTSPLWQDVPLALVVHAVVLRLGTHVWHALAGFTCPGVATAPPMKHPLAQVPAWHTSPCPHEVPFASVVQAVVLTSGWQLWHALEGFGAPAP
jgi:hypothetical protein